MADMDPNVVKSSESLEASLQGPATNATLIDGEENFWVKPGTELLGVTARGVLARLLAGVNSIKLGDRMRDIQPAIAWYVATNLAGKASPGTQFLAKRKKNGAADVLCEILNRHLGLAADNPMRITRADSVTVAKSQDSVNALFWKNSHQGRLQITNGFKQVLAARNVTWPPHPEHAAILDLTFDDRVMKILSSVYSKADNGTEAPPPGELFTLLPETPKKEATVCTPFITEAKPPQRYSEVRTALASLPRQNSMPSTARAEATSLFPSRAALFPSGGATDLTKCSKRKSLFEQTPQQSGIRKRERVTPRTQFLCALAGDPNAENTPNLVSRMSPIRLESNFKRTNSAGAVFSSMWDAPPARPLSNTASQLGSHLPYSSLLEATRSLH